MRLARVQVYFHFGGLRGVREREVHVPARTERLRLRRLILVQRLQLTPFLLAEGHGLSRGDDDRPGQRHGLC